MTAAMKTNGAALRAIRKGRGLKLVQLADRLITFGGATAKVPHLCNIEAGKRDASDELRSAIAHVLGVPVEAIELQAVRRDPAA